jgi:hypothetical protein
VDVNEGGRAAMEMIVRELSQMEVSGYPAITNLQTKLSYPGSTSFFSRVTPGNKALFLAYQSDAMPPVEDAWAKEQGFRTNILQDFTFTSRGDSGFLVTNYRVIDVTNGIGTLARYRINGTLPVPPPEDRKIYTKTERFNIFYFHKVVNTTNSVFEPITDGVIHLRITPYDQLGRPLGHDRMFYDPLGLNLERRGAAGQALFLIDTNRPVDGVLMQDHYVQSQAEFYGALPSYFDVEMAVLEPQIVKQARALPEVARVQTNFLGRQIGKVTLFRQRVPIRDMK